MIKTLYNNDTSELARQAVEILSQHINELLKTQDYITLAVPGGRSVRDIFAALKNKENINWSKVHIFMVDERLVPMDDPVSNYLLAKQSFIDHLINNSKLPEENVHPFFYEKKAEDYETELERFGDKYDIVIAGVGEDCHVAALFPDHPALDEMVKNFTILHDSPKQPLGRMTATPKLLKQTKVAFILFINEAKTDAYKTFLDLKIDYHQCPAKILSEVENLYIVTNINL